MTDFRVGERRIGQGHSCYIIAEISCNHEGSLEEAVKIVEAAAFNGADAVKIQTYTPDTMTRDFGHRPEGTLWESIDLYGLYQKAHTPWGWHRPLQARAHQLGLDFFSSPFDETAVDFLCGLGVPALKIASFEVVDTKLLQKAAQTGLPILMSTGMTDYLELYEAVQVLRDSGCREFALFQCNSGYPSSFDDANLQTIPVLKHLFGVPVGLSDHIIFADTASLDRPLAHVSPLEAVRHGADLIEVHLTLDRERARALNVRGEGGFDWAFSRNPEEFAKMVRLIRDFEATGRAEYSSALERECAERARGTVRFEPTEKELSSRKLRPSLWVTKSIAKGESLAFAGGTSEGNFDSLRPQGGLAIRFTDLVEQCRARRSLNPGAPLAWPDLALPGRWRLRMAADIDIRDYWEINNHPSVRVSAFTQSDIPWTDHQAWYANALSDERLTLYVVEEDALVQAVIRFEKVGDALGEVSVAVRDGQRGRGIGSWAISKGTSAYLLEAPEIRQINAYIRTNNETSLRTFEKCGYRREGDCLVREQPVVALFFRREAQA